MIWNIKQLPQIDFIGKTIPVEQFSQKYFPKKIQSNIYEWQTFGEDTFVERKFGYFDDFTENTLPRYATTINNGYIIISDGFLNTEAGTETKSGYTRIAHKQGFLLNRPYTIKSLWRINQWHPIYSDIACGFSTEAQVGNTAYRGDLSIWLDRDTFKLFRRATRTSPIYTTNLAVRTINAGDWIYLEIEHNNNQTRYLIKVNNITLASGQIQTYVYTVPMYAVCGVRHGAVATPVTNISIDYLAYLSDTVSSSIITMPGYMYNSVIYTKYQKIEFPTKQINQETFMYKNIQNLNWSIKNAS